MNKTLIGAALVLLAGCGEDGGKTYCEILLPLAALSAPQGGEGLADYCIECNVGGETYLVVNSYFDGIEAYPVESGELDGCGQLSFYPGQTITPGPYIFELGTYQVPDYGEYEYGDHAGAVELRGATITLNVTGEDCGNGSDDDDDGAADCDDLDNCAATEACL